MPPWSLQDRIDDCARADMIAAYRDARNGRVDRRHVRAQPQERQALAG